MAKQKTGKHNIISNLNLLLGVRYKKGEVSPMKGKKHSEESKIKMSEAHKGTFPSAEVRLKLSLARTGKRQSAEAIQKRTETRNRNGFSHSEESKNKMSLAKKGKPGHPVSEETKLKISIARKGTHLSEEQKRKLCGKTGVKSPNYGKSMPLETKVKISESVKKRYSDPEYIQRKAVGMQISPNKPETKILKILDSLYPNEWKFTGDWSFTISGRNPDFVNCNGQKKIIELFGDYWHKGENPQDRADIFSPFGYETLVIWECELKNMGSVKRKIRDFHELKTI